MHSWCLQYVCEFHREQTPENSCDNPDLCEKMRDLANFVYAAGRSEQVDCESLKDRVSWLSEAYGEDLMAIDIVSLLSEYSQIHCK